jgi:hypothetical protein
MEINWIKVGAIGTGVLLVGSLAWAGIAQNNLNQSNERLQELGNVLRIAEDSNLELNNNLEELKEQVAGLGLELIDLREQTEADKQIIADYEEELAKLQEELKEEEVESGVSFSYIINDLELGQTFSELITYRDFETLKRYDVRFDRKDYRVVESVEINGKNSINEKDFKENPYLVLERDAVNYKVEVLNLDTSLVSSDKPLKINFLGNELEIVNWNTNRIDLKSTDSFFLEKEEVLTFLGKEVFIKLIGEDFILVDVDGKLDKISEGESTELNGLEIYLDFAVKNEFARIEVSDIESDSFIRSGDLFEEGSIFRYEINSNSINLVLDENLVDLDDFYDFKALGAGESLIFPNNYLTLTYNGLEDLAYQRVSVQYDSRNEFVILDADFYLGANDYRRIYVNESGMFYYNSGYEFINSTKVGIFGTDSDFELNLNRFIFEDFEFEFNFGLGELELNGVFEKEDNFRTPFGLVINFPENNFERNRVIFNVPEEQAKASLVLN